MLTRSRSRLLALALGLLGAACPPPPRGQPVDPSATGPGALRWSTHFATGSRTRKVALDARGAVFVLAPLGVPLTSFGSHALEASTAVVGPDTVQVGSAVAKLDGTGQVLWAVVVDNGDPHEASGLATDQDGDVYVSGQATSLTVGSVPVVTPQGEMFGFLVKLDGVTGALAWSKVFTSPRGPGSATVYSAGCNLVAARGAHVGVGCFCDGTSELVISGAAGVEARAPCHGVYSSVLAVFAAAGGTLEWSTSQWSSGGHAQPLAVDLDDQGGLFASILADDSVSDSAGASFPMGTGGVTVKYAAGGAPAWSRLGQGPLAFSASGLVAVVSQGGRLLEGLAADTGAVRWSSALAEATTTGVGLNTAAVTTDDLGRVTVSGTLHAVPGVDLPTATGCELDSFMLVRWSASGTPLWARTATPVTPGSPQQCFWFWDDTPVAAGRDGTLAWGLGGRGDLTLTSGVETATIPGPDAIVLRFEP